MRNLKRAFSLMLSVIMVISVMVVSAGAVSYDDFSDKDQVVNTEAVSNLVELGVIAGKDDGSYDPSGIVTRAEMAKMICVVLNGGKDPQLGSVSSYTYADTVGHWAAAYIEYCTTLGIVAGDGTGNFNPSATVTGAQAAKMLLVAAGYQASIEGFTGVNWDNAVNVRANQVGLYDDLVINPSEGLTRDDAAQMVYNALSADVVTYAYTLVTDGNGGVTSIPTLAYENASGDEVTVLEDKFGVEKVEGVVTGNEYATVTENSSNSAAQDEGKTRIALLDGSDGVSGVYSVSTPADMLGKAVTMYVKYKTAGSVKDAKVIGTPVVNDDTQTYVTTDGTSVEDALDDDDLSLSADTLVFKNYEDVTPATVSDVNVDSALSVVTGGTLTLIDYDNDDVVDYVVYNEYTAGVVTLYSSKDDGTIKITGFDKNENAYDEVVGFEDVAKGDYVLAIEYGGKIYVEKPETITGDLTSYSTSKETAGIDDTSYDWSGITNSVASATDDLDVIADYVGSDALDDSATFYLDNNGNVLAVGDADSSTSSSYAVVLAFQDYEEGDAATLGKDAKVKLLLDDGTISTYTVYSINGEKPSSDANYTAEEDLILVNGANNDTGTDVGYNTIVSYKLTDDDEVKLTTETDADSVTTEYDSGKSWAQVGSTVTVTSSTIFLYYDGDDSYCYVGKTAPSINKDAAADEIAGVILNSDGEAKLIYIYAASESSFDDNFMYIYKEEVSENSDGYEVSAIVNGVIETVTVDSDSYVANVLAGYATADMKITTGMYTFSVDSDGIYTLDTDGTYTDSGFIAADPKDYVKLDNGRIYTLTSDTEVLYGRTNKTAADGETLSNGDEVSLVFNDDGEVVYAIITYYASDMDAVLTGVTATAGSPVLNTTAKTITMDLTANGTLTSGDFTLTYSDQATVAWTIADTINGYVADGDSITVTSGDGATSTTYTFVDNG